MKNHIHLIPADFDSFNLEDLDNENKNSSEKGVCWLNGSNNGYGSQEFYENDTVYIFFHDTKHITDRILLKANVCETDYNIKNEYLFTEYSKRRLNNKNITNEEKYDYQKYAKGKYKGFYLNEFHAINEIDAHNDVFKCKYKNDVNNNENIGINGVKINQTKRYLDLSTNPNEVNLMCYLEKTKFNRSLKKLISEFNNNACIYCKGKQIENNTFKKPNGLLYFEIHHIFQKNFNNIIGKLDENQIKEKYPWYNIIKYGTNDKNKLVYNNFNEIRLCSKHHNELHYGTLENRHKILDALVNENYKNELHKLVNNKKIERQILEYIYSQYNLKY